MSEATPLSLQNNFMTWTATPSLSWPISVLIGFIYISFLGSVFWCLLYAFEPKDAQCGRPV